MNENSRGLTEAETPVNPYSLLEAVNRSSRSVSGSWLIFLGLMVYLLVTVAGVTHKDLLLDSPVTLPILQVQIELKRFFLAAPVLFLILHMGVVGQLVLLARKALEFAASIRMLETTDRRTHPLRLELDNFFFAQAIAGPERSRIVGTLLHAMSWLTLVLLPVLLLLYVQLMFLPYHDAAITMVHRVVVLVDIAFVLLIGVFLIRPEESFFRAFLSTGRHNPASVVFTTLALLGVALIAIFVANIPRPDQREERVSLLATADGALLGTFPPNLRVTDASLVARDVDPGARSLSLRGRDLRFARLDRTDLHQADFTGANLDGATLTGADLRGVQMSCGDLALLAAGDGGRSAARCASARGADFARARLTDARMSGADLSGARLEGAQLNGAVLARALLPAANVVAARMDGADLAGASLPGAILLRASLHGADLAGAGLQLADFTGAALQGANLSRAHLEGAILREADLEGASLQGARLTGANLSGARLQATDLSGSVVWRTTPPSAEASAFSDMADIVMRAPADADIVAMKAVYERGPWKTRLAEGLAPLIEKGANTDWVSSADAQLWQGVSKGGEGAATPEIYKSRLTDYLSRLACGPRFPSGAVASGIVHRAIRQGFKGDVVAFHDRLRAADCATSAGIPRQLMRELAVAAETVRAVPKPTSP